MSPVPGDGDDDDDLLARMIPVRGQPITIWDEIWIHLSERDVLSAFLADIGAVSEHPHGVMLSGDAHWRHGHGVFPSGTFPCAMSFIDPPDAGGLRRAWKAGFAALIVPLAPLDDTSALEEEHGYDCLDKLPELKARGIELLDRMRAVAAEGLAGADFSLEGTTQWKAIIVLANARREKLPQ